MTIDERIIQKKRHQEESKAPIAGFLITVVCAGVLSFLLSLVPDFGKSVFSYTPIAESAPHSFFNRFLWFIQDFTNAQFYASVLAGIGLLIGAWIAYTLNTKKRRAGGFTIGYILHLFPWILAAQLTGLIVSVFAPGYVHLLETLEMGWVPTFIPFVSVPVIVVFVFGPSLKSVLTGGILSGLLSTPIATFLIKFILDPLGLPAVSANVFTMALVGILVLETCRYLPWMEHLENDFYQKPEQFHLRYGEQGVPIEQYGVTWFMRRVLADFTEAQFYGNEWASGLMLLGVIVHFVLDRSGVYYGNDFVPLLLFASTLSSAVGVLLYHKQWKKLGFYPTFTPVVTVVPGIILLVEGDVVLSLIVAVLGGIITPPFADMMNRNIPKGWHPMIGNTLSMSICTMILALLVKALPIIGIGY